MSYDSVDQLQKVLTDKVFHYAKDSKKAAGRALGTIVEIITYYLLKSWGFNNLISIERKISEYGNTDISHNVEYSLHPTFNDFNLLFHKDNKSITSNAIWKAIEENIKDFDLSEFEKSKNTLLSKNHILRNSCTIGISRNTYLVATIIKENEANYTISISEQNFKPIAIFECKRVGVEEGTKKGPQTIEKAKQGAYVARSVSSLQKIRINTGEMYGVVYKNDKIIHSKSYYILLDEVINSDDPDLLKQFTLTVGIVSNHGNWFTSNNHNKELKVLNQSYDWLLFLTDEGITKFIEELILKPNKENKIIRESFLASYSATKKINQFTKVKMNKFADVMLQTYFNKNLKSIERWFNIITENKNSLEELKNDISVLKNKNWINILG